MNLYFGKISSKTEKKQITDGYYRATRDSSWFSGIQPGDYCFTIGGGKVQLWKAKSWGKRSGDDVLEFEIIHKDLGINTKKLTAIKYFKLTMELAVLTVRSTAKSKKAFFPIEYLPEFNEILLLDIQTYKNDDTFRKIHILKEGETPNKKTSNLQLYNKEGKWTLYPADFISRVILEAFSDKTAMFGGGQVNKDKTIEKVISPANAGKLMVPDALSILQVYDLFCCAYKSNEIFADEDETKEAGGVEDSEFETAIKGDCNVILYGPPGTGKTYEVLSLIDELNTNENVGVQIEHKGNLNLNKTFWHLAPGRNGYLWENLKKSSHLGYEWCGKELGDLKKLDPSIENFRIRRRFSEVKKGDYICIIRGRQCLGIAEAKEDYDFKKAEKGPFEFQTIEVDWKEKFDIPILLNTTSTKTFSGINGGQRWKALVEGLREKGFTSGEEQKEKTVFKRLYQFTTFHQSYSYEDFIEGIKPRLADDKMDEEVESFSEIEYEIKPGIFYQACDKAAQLAGYGDLQEALQDNKENRANKFSKAQPYYIIIDEINRGNVANIFGELITLIEKDKRLGETQETTAILPYSKEEFGVPSNLIIIGTMNTADRSIEALDSALRRRFSFINKAPEPSLLSKTKYTFADIDLEKLLTTINNRLEVLLDRDHLIGHSYFMGIKSPEDLVSCFRNKVVPLLEEYFFGKPERIGMVLGPSFVKQKPEVRFFPGFEEEFSNIQERKQYYITIPESLDDYKSIYANS